MENISNQIAGGQSGSIEALHSEVAVLFGQSDTVRHRIHRFPNETNLQCLWRNAVGRVVAREPFREKLDGVINFLQPNRTLLDKAYQEASINRHRNGKRDYIQAFAATGRKYTDEPLSSDGRSAQDCILESLFLSALNISKELNIVFEPQSAWALYTELQQERAADFGGSIPVKKKYDSHEAVYEPDFGSALMRERPLSAEYKELSSRMLEAIRVFDLQDISKQAEIMITKVKKELWSLLQPYVNEKLDLDTLNTLSFLERHDPKHFRVNHVSDLRYLNHKDLLPFEDSLMAARYDEFIETGKKLIVFAEIVKQQGGIVHFDGPSKSPIRRYLNTVRLCFK